MSEGIVDEIAPDTLAQNAIGLSILQKDLLVGTIILVDVDYSVVESEESGLGGVVLPLIYTVTQPSGLKLVRRLYKLIPPRQVSFQPEVGGRHLIRLGEAFHNRTWGSLIVDVRGGTDDGLTSGTWRTAHTSM